MGTTLHSSSSLNCMTECLAIDSDVCLCTNSLRVLIAAWLNAAWCSIEQVCQRFKRKLSALSNREDWILRYIRTYFYFILHTER